MVKVFLPTNFRSYVDGKEFVEVNATTVREVVEELDTYGIKKRIIGNEGILRFINIYIDDEDVRFLEGLDTEVEDKDVVIMAAISGG